MQIRVNNPSTVTIDGKTYSYCPDKRWVANRVVVTSYLSYWVAVLGSPSDLGSSTDSNRYYSDSIAGKNWDVTWIDLVKRSGEGGGTFEINVSPNNGGNRVGAVEINNLTLRITQTG